MFAGQADDEEADRFQVHFLGVLEGLTDGIMIDLLVDAHQDVGIAALHAKGRPLEAGLLELAQQFLAGQVGRECR